MATRVALITPPLDSSGGIGRLMAHVVAAMPAEGITVRLLDTRGHSPRPALSIFPLARAWVKLVFLGLTRRIDVAHINMSSHGSSIRKPIMLWTCRLFRIPVALHLHASEYPEYFANQSRPLKAFLRRTFSSADIVLVLGRSWRDYVCRELQVSPRKVRVLLNAAPGPAAVTEPEVRSVRPLGILFLGRLGERKGTPDLLRALADARIRNEQWVATLAGDGDVVRYRGEAEKLGLGDRVNFPGWISASEAQELLAKSDLLVLPSRAEGLPMSVIEAFAYGLPVVSTPVGGIPDILEDGVNGLFVRPGDDAQLANAIFRIFHDESLRLRLAKNARRTWEERLDVATFVHDLARCWRQLMAQSSPGSIPTQVTAG